MTDFPLEFTSAEERTKFIKDNADYYTITWRQNRQNKRFEYDTLETARFQAQIAANSLKRHISIYGVVCPFSDVMLPAKDYIARNHDIVDDTDILYACPDGPEKVRSGTWATIRYALKQKKKVVIFHPEESNVSQHSSPNVIDNT